MPTEKRSTILISVISVLFSITVLTTAIASDTIQKPHTFSPGTPAKASEVNENFDALYEKINVLSTEVRELKASTYDCITVNTLKEAYLFAQQYFLDYPAGTITLDVLTNEGLNLADGVDLKIENGTIAESLMSARHVNTGKTYSIDQYGTISPDDDFSSLAASYIALLAGQWEKNYNSEANSAIKNAYTAAQAYFTDYPTSSITILNLQESGYQASRNVTITIKAAKQENLLLTSSHTQGNKLYIVDQAGSIISENIGVGDKNINDLLSAYTASQAFFKVHPDATVTYQNLVDNGYQASNGVTLTIADGLKSSLLIEATHHQSNNIYKIDHAGVISVN
jgi:hypothetical protein